jgi:hypothetical protein
MMWRDRKGPRKSFFDIASTGLVCAFWLAILTCAAPSARAAEDLRQLCKQAKNDDTVRAYSPELEKGTIAAYGKLFPDAQDKPDQAMLQSQAQYRCMNGKVLVCFIGANLPCAKMNTSRKNPGAAEFCRQNPNEDSVPAAATGHDTIYNYRCRHGRAQVTDMAWKLDRRGFAEELWTELPE